MKPATAMRLPRKLSARAFSSTVAPALEAESSRKGQARPGETVEASWRRNLDEAREWRRRAAAIQSQTHLVVPGKPAPSPRRGPREASLSTLMASGAALGHSASLLAPPYLPYVYGTRAGLSVIDLEQTLPLLRRAASLVRDVVKADGVVVIVGTRESHRKAVEKAQARLEDNGYGVLEWMPGTLTNSETYFGMEPMEKRYHVPDLVIFLNPSENLGAIRECTARNVPTVGIVDTDTDPRIVTYPIPANMESTRTAELVAATLSIAGQEGRAARVREAHDRARARSTRRR